MAIGRDIGTEALLISVKLGIVFINKFQDLVT
jgi:hypothetical protein